MDTIVSILMSRDGYSKEEAIEAVNEARKRVLNGEDPEVLLEEEFGLEPDYIFDLL